MNESRQRELLAGVAANARKVFDVVPIEDAWGLDQLLAEVRRLGSGMDSNVLKGCLASLIERALVCEVSPRRYQRAPIRTKSAAAEPASVTASPVPAVSMAPNAPPLDRLAAIASKLKDLAAGVTALALAIEDAALDIEADQNARDGDAEKARRLRELLKEFS